MSYSHDGAAPAASIEELSRQLHGHEGRSQERYEDLCGQLTRQTERKMGMTDIADKVNIHVGGDGGGGGAAGMAALVAALGNRNEGGDTAALIAALGNRNDGMGGGMAALAPMLAGMNGNGMNNLWPIILLALLGRGRGGGLFGGDDCGGGGAGGVNQITDDIILNKLGDIQGSIPLASAQTENVILQQTNTLSTLANQNSMATAAGFSSTKDAVQNLALALSQAICGVNQNVSGQGCQTREAVQNDGDKTRALLTSRFQQEDATRIQELSNEVTELRAEGRRRADHDELRLSISNNNVATATQAQGQAQFQVQSQLQELANTVRSLAGMVAIGNQTMLARQAQDIVNLGTMTASGTQAAANTQVR